MCGFGVGIVDVGNLVCKRQSMAGGAVRIVWFADHGRVVESQANGSCVFLSPPAIRLLLYLRHWFL